MGVMDINEVVGVGLIEIFSAGGGVLDFGVVVGGVPEPNVLE